MGDRLLDGKSVVITGAGSGVGRAAAEVFARHGARLIVTDIRQDWLDKTVAKVTAAGGEAKSVICDVRSRADVQAAVDAAVETYGRLDVMYNNAGIASPAHPTGAPKKFVENTDDEMQLLFEVNIRGVYYGCQSAILQFLKQGGGGAIVNTASIAGMMGWGGALYGSTKGAIVNLTRTLAIEHAKDQIRVNSVCPGAMVTNFGIGAKGPPPEAVLENMRRMLPMGNIPTAEDSADGALYLASDLARNVTGVNLPVDGGMLAGK